MNQEFEYKEEYQYLTNIMLNVTDACNLACRYCFVEQHPHYMTLDMAKKIVDWTYENLQKKKKFYPDLNKCRYNFFGGEPTLCYDSIIVPIVEYCNEKYPDIFNFGITTNGTLLNKERIDFFKKNNFSLLLSIDGAAETQNYNRPCQNGQESFKLIEKNIPYLLEIFPNITFRSTGYAPTIHHLFENYLYAESLGFKSYMMVLDIRHHWTKQQIEILKQEINKIYFYRLKQIANNITPMYFEEFNKYLKLTIECNYQDSQYFQKEKFLNVQRCGLATTLGAIGWDGSIYGCQEQVSKDNKNIFYLGNILKNGIEQDRHIQLLQYYYNNIKSKELQKEECFNCKISPICSVNYLNCPSSTFDLYNNMSILTQVHCELAKCLYENSLLLLLIASESNDKNIDQYIQNNIKK